MNQPELCKELQRLGAAVASLHARCGNHVLVELNDGSATCIELVYRLHGRYVRGAVRSSAGNANFELWLGDRKLKFRHPAAGAAGELAAKPLPVAAARALTFREPESTIAETIVRMARRLEHVSVLRRVQVGIRERRETALPLAS